MTALGDAYTGIVFPIGLMFQGTGLTASQRLLVTDTAGDVISDSITAGTTDSKELLNGREARAYQGIKLAAGTLAGTWTVTVILE